MGFGGRQAGCRKKVFICLSITTLFIMLDGETWVSENWLVLGALKRTTKGSLEKASTSPGRLSGYWYWPVTVTVSVLKAFRQTHYSQWCRHVLVLSGASVDTVHLTCKQIHTAPGMSQTCPVSHWPQTCTHVQCHTWDTDRKEDTNVRSGHEWQLCCTALMGLQSHTSYCVSHLLMRSTSWGTALSLMSLTSWSKHTSQRAMIWNRYHSNEKVLCLITHTSECCILVEDGCVFARGYHRSEWPIDVLKRQYYTFWGFPLLLECYISFCACSSSA